jgi:N4-gp56 family major capsid protein
MSTPSTSLSSNFQQAHIDAYIRKDLLQYGPNRHLLRRFANKEKLPQGQGIQWKALRSERIQIPLTSLTEGAPPNNIPVTISTVTATAIQWGIVVILTDVLMLTLAAPVFQEAVRNVSEAMERLDDKLLHDTLLASVNMFYPVKTYTSRGSLTNVDVPSTKLVRRIVSSLRLGTTRLGGAIPLEGKQYAWVIHEKHVMDMQSDTTWDQYAARLNADALETGVVNKWEGCNIYSSNFMPQYVDIGCTTAGTGNYTTALSSGLALSGTVGTSGFKVTNVASGGAIPDASTMNYIVTRKDLYRGFEEGISQPYTLTSSSGGGINSETIVFPTSTSFVYQLYAGTAAGACYLVASNQLGGSTFTLTYVPGSGVLAPAVFNSTTSAAPVIYPGYLFGKDAFAVVDLDNLQAFITPLKAVDSDPLIQRRSIGAKFFLGSLILQDVYMARYEATSAF